MKLSRPQGRRAFSLTELLVTIVVIAIISAGILYTLPNVTQASSERMAVARAQALNAAKSSLLLRNPSASSAWASASTDEARFALLIPYLAYAQTGDTLAAFSPSGFSFTLGSLDQRTVVTNSATSTVVTY